MSLAKILILSHYWSPENGVPQRRWRWITEILVDAGHEVSVICPPPHYPNGTVFPEWEASDQETGPSGEKILRTVLLPFGNSSSLTAKAASQAFSAVCAMLVGLKVVWQRQSRPDVIIGTVPALPTALVTRALASFSGTPYIIDLRDAWPDLLRYSQEWNSDTGRKTFKERIIRKMVFPFASRVIDYSIDSTLRRARAILVTSDWLGRRLKNDLLRTCRGFDTEVVTLRNVFPPSVKGFWKEPNTHGNPLKILYAGTLGRAQMLTNTLEALQLLKDTNTKIQLRFVGGGAALDHLKRKAEKDGLNVEFIPRVSVDQMSEHYRWCDSALVHLTGWTPLLRAVPSKTYELMECGVHITGVVEGETAEIITELKAGHVVNTDDPSALAELWRELSSKRDLAKGSSYAKSWVVKEREEIAPQSLTNLIESILRSK